MWLRAGSPADARDLFAVQRAAALAGYGHIFPQERYPFPDQKVAELCFRLLTDPAESVLVAIDEDRVVGYVGTRDDVVTHLYVAPERWHRGIGGRLLAAAVDTIRGAGHATCRLQVLVDNRRARALYERRGWRPDGTTGQARFPPHPATLGYQLVVSDPRQGARGAPAPPFGSTDDPGAGTGTAPARTGPPRG